MPRAPILGNRPNVGLDTVWGWLQVWGPFLRVRVKSLSKRVWRVCGRNRERARERESERGGAPQRDRERERGEV